MKHTHSVAVNLAIITFQENNINAQLILSLILKLLYIFHILFQETLIVSFSTLILMRGNIMI
jgi:hypothetical protein